MDGFGHCRGEAHGAGGARSGLPSALAAQEGRRSVMTAGSVAAAMTDVVDDPASACFCATGANAGA